MDWQVLRAYLSCVPFVPFRFEKTGGAWFEVKNPAMVSGQRFVTVALIHVISVEIVESTTSE